jgi:hypothetical protein
MRDWGSSVAIGTGYGLNNREVQFTYRQKQEIFLFFASNLTSCPMDTVVAFLRGEADHSPTSSAEIKNGGAIPPINHVFMT